MDLPSEARIVFKGKIFDVYQWDQTLFDGSTAVFEMLKRPNTVQIIPVKDGKICLAYEKQPKDPFHFSFLGGRCEEGEEPLETAKRELLEESGLTSDDWELLSVDEPFHKIQWKIFYYVARNCKKVQEPHLDAGEDIQVKEVDFEEFLSRVADPSFDNNRLTFDLLRIKDKPPELAAFKQRLYGTITP